MSTSARLISEEDVRTKVVTMWLADHGFGPQDISVEFTFELRLGRNILVVDSHNPVQARRGRSHSAMFRPRTDVLVRSRRDHRNLLIIEVKAPDEPLDDDAREQGISYARLLREGGIAPFVILTNGNETHIYDSISGERLTGVSVPPDHPYARNGFRVTCDDLALRAEALETLISLDADNLLEFCHKQVECRMQLLRSNDPFSGKKYIPQLYIDRPEAEHRLIELLDKDQRNIVVLVGPPQVGKTNFVCHTVEKWLSEGKPCLLFPAIGMTRSLIEEIGDDFDWIIGERGSVYSLIHNRLLRILHRTNQQLIIFIDGWNEPELELARTIDRDSRKLSSINIRIVISMTHVTASRLLLDNVGNLSFIAEAASISAHSIPKIEASPDRVSNRWSVVPIGKYTNREIKDAYSKYTRIYGVKISNRHRKVSDPFLLRIGMEVFHGKQLPDLLDEPTLLEQSINRKADRAADVSSDVVRMLLSELADEMFLNGHPVDQRVARKRWGIPVGVELPRGLFEAALLAKMLRDHSLPALDFYYGRERDLVVAYWARQWPRITHCNPEAMIAELSLAARSQVGVEALRWFLKLPVNTEYLQSAAQNLSAYADGIVRRIILSSLCASVSRKSVIDGSWLRDIVRKTMQDSDLLVRVEAARLMALITKDDKELASVLSDDYELIEGLLSIDEEYPIVQESASDVVLDALRLLHQQDAFGEEESSISSVLVKLANHPSSTVRSGAIRALGGIAPKTLLRTLSEKINALHPRQLDPESRRLYQQGLMNVMSELQERYYGSMCPGWLDGRSNEELYYEYTEMTPICVPVIMTYLTEQSGRMLLSILESLRPEDTFIDDVRMMINDKLALRYQLSLPFDDLNAKTSGT